MLQQDSEAKVGGAPLAGGQPTPPNKMLFQNPKNKKEKEIPESKEVGTVSEPNSPLHPPEVNLWSSPKYQVLRKAGRKLAEADDVTVSADIFQLCFPLLHFLFCHRIN